MEMAQSVPCRSTGVYSPARYAFHLSSGVLVYLIVWLAVWFWWPNRPFGIGIAVGLVFAIYGYYQTLWKNAAIEKWKYGLPGTGKQNPKNLNPIT
jgi:hypothetical protein